MKHVTIVALTACVSLFSGSVYAQGPDPSQVQIRTTDLGHNVYMLQGGGGNVAIAVGSDGVIMVDAQFAPMHDKLKAAIANVTNQPIKYLVNTHFHGDHTGGNESFAKDGVTIASHQNLAVRLDRGSTDGLTGMVRMPAPKAAIPTKTYTTEGLQLMVTGQAALINHPTSAHTDTDSYVYFPAANVIVTGDIVSIGERYVIIDYANGGSISGTIAMVETFIKMGNDQTKYVPGHGPLSSRADLQRFHDMLVSVRDAVQAEIKAGKTEEQALAAKPLAAIGAPMHTTPMADDNMVKMVYRSLTGVGGKR